MSNLMYVFKIIGFTILVVILMQVEVGHKTVEHHAEQFIRKSSLMEPARQIAQGGFLFFKHFYRGALSTVDSFVTKEFRSENSPGQRKLTEFRRSMSFQTESEKRQKLKEQKASREKAQQEDENYISD